MHKERKHIRLRNFDYSSEGCYFITFNIKNRLKILSQIVDEKVSLSGIGKIADESIKSIPVHFPNAILDEYCIMPDHIHCIVFLIKEPGGINVGSKHFIPPLLMQRKPVNTPKIISVADIKYADQIQLKSTIEQFNKFGKPVKGSISVIIQQFKSTVTREANKKGMEKIIWQGRFHDHVVRSEEEYLRIKKYIQNNPANWKKDKGPRPSGHHM